MAPPVPTVTLKQRRRDADRRFGVFQIPPDETEQAVATALEAPHLAWSPWSAPARGSRTASSSKDPTNQEVIGKPRDQGGHETGRHVGQQEPRGQVRLLDGVGVHGRTQTCRVGR